MPVVDTLKLKTRLSESGMPEPQAQVLVEELDEALGAAIARETASKADVVELRAAIHGLEERFDQRLEQVDRRLDELKADYAGLKTEIVNVRSEIGNVWTEIGNVKIEIGNLKGEIKLLRWMGGILVAIQLGIWIRLLFM